MQILKEKVREKIVESSIELFEKNGYNNTSMQDIAKKANVSVGNIYRYFKTKKDLLDSLLQEVEIKVEEIVNKIPVHNRNYNDIIQMLVQEIVCWCKNNRSSMQVLLACRENLQYISFKENITNVLIKRFEQLQKERKIDGILLLSIVNSIFDGITYIVANVNNDINKMKKLLQQFMTISFNDIDNRIRKVCIDG